MPMSPGGLGALSGLGQGLSNLAPMYMQMQARKQNLAQREKELERQRDRDNFTRLANVFNMQVKLGDMEGAERTVQQFQGIEPEADYANLNYKGREKEYYADLNKILTNYRENSVQNPREAEQTLLDETGVLNAKYGFRREYTEQKVEEQRGLLQREEQRLAGLEREQRDILRTGRFERATTARGRLEPLTTLGTPGPGAGAGVGQPGLGPPDIQVPGQEGLHAVPEVAKVPRPPSLIQQYNLAKKQNYEGTFTEWKKEVAKAGADVITVGQQRFGIQAAMTAGAIRTNLVKTEKDNKTFFEEKGHMFNDLNKQNEVAYWETGEGTFFDEESKIIKLSPKALKAGWTPKKIQQRAISRGMTVEEVLKKIGLIE